jgi:hypothetical protein
MVALCDKPVTKMGTQKSGSAGNQNSFHGEISGISNRNPAN